MTERRIYINAAQQVSMQRPLSDSWLDSPVDYPHDGGCQAALDPDFKAFLAPMEARRMGRLLKRAVAVSDTVLAEASVSDPDAILTATGLECVENTEAFLNALCEEGEDVMMPTAFMQSTHNTIGSLLAIRRKCHGYNSTYAHKGVSFESALLDAVVQLRLGAVSNALVGAFDEMTPTYFGFLAKTGFVGQPGMVRASDSAVAMVLSAVPAEKALCELMDVRLMYRPAAGKVASYIMGQERVDAIVAGINGSEKNDKIYEEIASATGLPVMGYKHLFGENYGASAAGVYAAARCLHSGRFASLHAGEMALPEIRSVVVVNHDGRSVSVVKLESLC